MASTLQENQLPLQEKEGVNSTSNSNGGSACSTPNRKRAHPASLNIDTAAPPNKRIHTPTEKEEKETIMREKQILYKRLAEAEKNPFFLHPHQHPVFPFLPFPTNTKCTLSSVAPSPPTFYSLLQQQHSPSKGPLTPFPTPTPGSVSSANSSATTTTTQASSTNVTGTIGTSSTPPRPAYPSQFYPSFVKYPFSPPTPSSLGTLGLLSPWTPSNAAQIAGGQTTTDVQHSNPTPSSSSSALATSTPREASTRGTGSENGSTCANPGVTSGYQLPPPHTAGTGTPAVWQMAPTFPQPTTSTSAAPPSLPHLMSPRSGFASIQSPLSYFHPSPLSPMMFIHSPYASSVSSCPSVSSSSGCSSDGGNTSAPRKRRYAPSEYYVGPIRPLSEKIADEDNQSEGANNSGRNTPTDSSSDDSGTVVMATEVGMTHNLMHSSNQVNASVVAPSEVGMQYGTAMNDAVLRRPSQQGGAHGRQVQSPYPFSVESLSCSQPSSVGSNSHGYLHGCHAMSSVERPSSGVSSMSSSLSSRDSTPDPDPLRHDLKSDPNQALLGSDTFCLVPGRLSLLSSTQKYKVSVDEVRRRLSHPECLNASVLGGILRRAKSKNGGHVLRQRLESIGLSLPPGRRKATDLSLLTSLVEGETHHLASDFRRLCDNFFPHSELAHIIARQHTGTPEAQHRIAMVKASQLIVSELQAMLNAVGGPSSIKPTDPNNPYPGLTNFSLLTHGFGNPTINTSLGVLQTYLQELLTFYEGRKPIQPDGRYVFNEKLPPPPAVALDNPMMMYTGNQSVPGSNVSVKPTMTLKQEPMDSPNSCAL